MEQVEGTPEYPISRKDMGIRRALAEANCQRVGGGTILEIGTVAQWSSFRRKLQLARHGRASVELRGFEPLTPCMPFMIGPLRRPGQMPESPRIH